MNTQTEREWELFKRLSAIWPRCQDVATWITNNGTARPAPSTGLQDYLAEARRRCPHLLIGLWGNCVEAWIDGESWAAGDDPIIGRGETDCERILDTLLKISGGMSHEP